MTPNRKGTCAAGKEPGSLLRCGFYSIALLLMFSASLLSLGETQPDSFQRVSIGAFDPDAWNGIVFDSNGGFTLQDGSMRAADAAWVERSAAFAGSGKNGRVEGNAGSLLSF